MHCFPTSCAGAAAATTSGSSCSSLRPLLTTWLSLAGLSSEGALSRDLEEAAGVRNRGRLEAMSSHFVSLQLATHWKLAGTANRALPKFKVRALGLRPDWREQNGSCASMAFV